MSEELNREILDELKKINQKLDTIGEQRGISAPLKFIAIIIGVTIVGPLIFCYGYDSAKIHDYKAAAKDWQPLLPNGQDIITICGINRIY